MSEIDKLHDALERQSEMIAGLRAEIATKDKRITELEATHDGLGALALAERRQATIWELIEEKKAQHDRIEELEAITNGIAAYLKATYKQLPADVDFHYKLPTYDDGRFWIYALSATFAAQTACPETGSIDPVVDTFELVQTSAMEYTPTEKIVCVNCDATNFVPLHRHGAWYCCNCGNDVFLLHGGDVLP